MVDFFFWFWAKDQPRVFPLVQSIRQWYPDAGIVAMADGPVNKSMPILLREAGVKVGLSTERLKLPGQCEEYLLTGYRFLLSMSEADRFVQVDPDSVIRRRAQIPEVDWSGQIFWDNVSGIVSTVGAGTIFSRSLIQSLVERLESTTVKTDFRYKGQKEPSDDACYGYHLRELGFSPVPWTNQEGWLEVELLPKYEPYLEDDRWAITHPAAPGNDPIIAPLMALRGQLQLQTAQAIGNPLFLRSSRQHGDY